MTSQNIWGHLGTFGDILRDSIVCLRSQWSVETIGRKRVRWDFDKDKLGYGKILRLQVEIRVYDWVGVRVRIRITLWWLAKGDLFIGDSVTERTKLLSEELGLWFNLG